MSLKNLIMNLCDSDGVSGFEDSVTKKVADIFNTFCDEVYIDTQGSVHGIVKANVEGAKTLMLDAHIDEIGLMVTKISDGGYPHFTNIGGVDNRILPAMEVSVWGDKCYDGIICAKPPHIQTDDDMKKAIPLTDMVIDVGYTKDECEERINVGDMVTFKSVPQFLMNDAVVAKALDDRVGLCAIIEGVKGIKKEDLRINIEIIASTQEEVGLRGAKTASYLSNADMAIVVDVSHGKTPDESGQRTFTVGGGVMIGVGPNMNKSLTNRIIAIAKAMKIKHQIEVMGGDTGTNAWVVQVTKSSIPCALFSIPLKYMHTPNECVMLSDVKSVASLIKNFIKEENKLWNL